LESPFPALTVTLAPHLLRYAAWPTDAAPDRFCGDWQLWQRRGGHRTSADDLICAWTAAQAVPDARSYCDLGCGIGSVLLMTTWAVKPAIALGIEAQAQSSEMALRTIRELASQPAGGLAVLHSDFRELAAVGLSAGFDLVTGSPPYFPLGTGVPSPDPQRLACRFETRGGVEAYMEVARGLVKPDGRVVIVFQTQWTARVVAAGAASGFRLDRQYDFRTRADRPEPFLSTYVFAPVDGESRPTEHVSIDIRDAAGVVTDAYGRIRYELGLAS
jgi:tRNA1(Val) A37 N6-methylase TrmN6